MSQLNCPVCGNEESKVIDTRSTLSGLRRRRECEGCHKRFTTLETVIISEPIALAQEIKRWEEGLNELLTQADKVRARLVELRFKRAGQEKPKEPIVPKKRGRPRKAPETVAQPEQVKEVAPPVVINSLSEFNELSEGGKVLAIKQAFERARERVQKERNGAG